MRVMGSDMLGGRRGGGGMAQSMHVNSRSVLNCCR